MTLPLGADVGGGLLYQGWFHVGTKVTPISMLYSEVGTPSASGMGSQVMGDQRRADFRGKGIWVVRLEALVVTS